ncbi:MAG: cytidylate kinase-like family protein [Clostridiales bacterium]|nr:cytidylate kinase-like family protein [Clostridiales bacterium]
MRIITVSRQFGSGGRELGKRLAERLGWDYYDREIIDAIAENKGCDPDYVRRTLSNHGWHNVQLTYSSTFSQLLWDPGRSTELLTKEQEILRGIAEMGNDCVIIGRRADVILEEYRPFRLFVCADMSARLERCMRHEQNRPENERLTEKQILRNIRRIDRNRVLTREILTGKQRGDSSAFDLTVNTVGWEIPDLTEALAEFALRRFAE